MRHLRQRNIKIINELMNFLIKIGCENIHLDYHMGNHNLYLDFHCLIESLDEKYIKTMKSLLNVPRRHDMEEYYWELTGDDDLDTELSLVGMMIDEVSISYENNKELKLHLRREI